MIFDPVGLLLLLLLLLGRRQFVAMWLLLPLLAPLLARFWLFLFLSLQLFGLRLLCLCLPCLLSFFVVLSSSPSLSPSSLSLQSSAPSFLRRAGREPRRSLSMLPFSYSFRAHNVSETERFRAPALTAVCVCGAVRLRRRFDPATLPATSIRVWWEPPQQIRAGLFTSALVRLSGGGM